MSRPTVSVRCPVCKKLMHPAVVKANVWQGDRLVVVEDIPAQVCDICKEQYYDPLTQETMRSMLEKLHSETPKRVLEVPVYSLEGRIPELPARPAGQEEPEVPEDEY